MFNVLAPFQKFSIHVFAGFHTPPHGQYLCSFVTYIMNILSESDISSVDLDIIGTVSADINQCIRTFKAETVCKSHQEITKDRLMNQSKETLANCLLKGYHSHIDKLT